MQAKKTRQQISNRRAAFRIYEQANIFYRKLDRQAAEAGAGYDKVMMGMVEATASEQALPASQSLENDTLNVNISANGIAFTCKDELQFGDYLMLRILLLSSMTVIMTCCKVVYCKPSNPYETDRYPYSVGAYFVNLTAGDSELLHRHVHKRRKQQLAVNSLLAVLFLAVLVAPDKALDLLVGLGHRLLEIVLHLLHLGFEYLEITLDHLVEHQFHTDLHDTQIIVFYLLVTMGLIISYFVGRKIPAVYRRLHNRLILFLSRKKSSCLYFWDQQSLSDKIKIVGIGITAVAGYVYFSF